MSILSALKTYLAAYASLETGAPVWVNHLGPNPTEYSINPMPGNKIVEAYVDGGSAREYPFSFEIAVSTTDDPERVAYNEFGETFAEWLETQTLAGTLPTLAAGKTATAIEATNWGYLSQEGQSSTGIYLIVCKLSYEQQA
jgi:hypothetical protein